MVDKNKSGTHVSCPKCKESSLMMSNIGAICLSSDCSWIGSVTPSWGDAYSATALTLGKDLFSAVCPELMGNQIVQQMHQNIINAFSSMDSQQQESGILGSIMSEFATPQMAYRATLENINTSLRGNMIMQSDGKRSTSSVAPTREIMLKGWILMNALEQSAKDPTACGNFLLDNANLPEMYVDNLMKPDCKLNILQRYNAKYPLIDWGIVPLEQEKHIVHILLAIRSNDYSYTFCVHENYDSVDNWHGQASIIDLSNTQYVEREVHDTTADSIEEACSSCKEQFAKVARSLAEDNNVCNSFILSNRDPDDLLNYGHSIWSVLAHAFFSHAAPLELSYPMKAQLQQSYEQFARL